MAEKQETQSNTQETQLNTLKSQATQLKTLQNTLNSQEPQLNNLQRQLEEATAREVAMKRRLREIVQCPVCLSVPRDGHVLQCHRGHVTCQSCADRTHACPVCRTYVSQTWR